MSELQLLTNTYRARVLMSVIGPLNRRTASDLRTHLRRVLAADSELPIDLDLRCCIDIDTDGLLVLDAGQHAASVRGRNLRLVQVPPLIARVVRKHHLAHLLSGTGPKPNTPPVQSDDDDFSLEVPEADAVEQHLAVTDDEEPEVEQVGPSAHRLSLVPLEADPADVAEQQQPVPLDDEHPDVETMTPPSVDYHDR